MRETSAEETIPRDLLLRARDRDPAALEQFFDRVFPRVYGTVARLIRPREAAEDVCQEAFYRIHRAIDRMDPDRDPFPWILTIALNCCRKHWSSRAESEARRTATLDDPEGIGPRLSADGPSPEDVRRAQDRETAVAAALAALPEPLREAVVLHVHSGLGHDEIADLLGIGHAAARKRYSRAIARLGELLEDLGP